MGSGSEKNSYGSTTLVVGTKLVAASSLNALHSLPQLVGLGGCAEREKHIVGTSVVAASSRTSNQAQYAFEQNKLRICTGIFMVGMHLISGLFYIRYLAGFEGQDYPANLKTLSYH
jgi:hypothetical protein